MSELSPPYPLIRDGLRQGRVIPFLGAGASLGMHKRDTPRDQSARKHLPTAAVLARYLARKTRFPHREPRDLAKVAQYYKVIGGSDPLHRDLHGIFDRDYPLTLLHTFLADVPRPLLIVTTNYDDLIERAFSANGRLYDVVIHATDPSIGDRVLWWPHTEHQPREVPTNKVDVDLQTVTVIYKMHGTVDRREPKRDQYVITEDDYIDFLVRMTRNKAIPTVFADPFQTRHFLFLGYGLRDWNLRVVLNRIEKDFEKGMHRRRGITSWAIQYKPSPLEKRFWQEHGVEVFDMMIAEFVERLASQ
jgi:SIR2-like domain